MKRPALRLTIHRLFLLSLLSFVAVAALLGIAASANKANRAAKARAEQAANTKSAINPGVQDDKQQPLAPVIVATLTDNVTAATKVAPGGTINYTAVITNNGAASPADDASNLNFSAPLDANTTLVAGSVHASPIAFNDTYNWVGNTFLDTAARALPAVTANDVAVNAPAGTDTFTVTAIAGGATALGGTVTLASPSGSFVYTPPLGRPTAIDGATVQDSFTYTITNNADGALTSTGTVRINLTGRVWFLQAGAAGDGRSNTPSSSPAAMSTAADKSTDVFYIFSNAGSLNGPFSVDAGQQLLGQGVNLVVSAITLFNSAAPTPTTTNGAGNCVTLAGAPGNNTLSGFNIGNCTGGTAIIGANVGTLNVSTMSINTNGAGLDLTGSGLPTVSVVLGGLTSTSGARNVNLVGMNGTFTLASGALSGATGNALHVDNGNGGLTYSGTISNSGARQVNIINKTGGTVALSGAISGTGTGIFLNANNGATLNFTGGIALSTGANAAFTATGPGPAATSGGTINVTQNNTTIVNTLTTSTGTALNVAHTTIGASGMTFRSIASNGAVNGILLNNTGATGGLAVTGAGAAGTGGTIQNSTNSGIKATSVTGLSLDRLNVTNNGNGVTDDDEGIKLENLSGTASITNSSVTGSSHHNLFLDNTSGTLASLTITGCTFNSAVGGNGMLFRAVGTSAVTAVSVTGNTFSDNQVIGMHVIAEDTATVTLFTASGNTFTDANAADGLNQEIAFDFSQNDTGNLTFKALTNTITNHNSHGMNIATGAGAGTGGTLKGTIDGNTIGNAAVAGSGSKIGNGIRVNMNGQSVNTLLLNNNTIREAPVGRGIEIQGRNGTGQTDVTVTNNNVNHVNLTFDIPNGSNFPLGAIVILSNTAGTAGYTVRSDVRGNTVPTAGGALPAASEVTATYLTVQELPPAGGSIHQLVDTPAGPGGQTPTQQLQTSNTGDAGANAGVSLIAGPINLPPPIANPAEENATKIIHSFDNHLSFLSSSYQSPSEKSRAKAPMTIATAKQVMAPAHSSAIGKATPKASAAEVARIYRSERPLSHHPVFRNKNVFSQDPNAPLAGEIVTLNTIATFPAAGKSITIKYSATVNTPPLARQVSTQGTVTANAGAISVLTDDPEPAGAANPTVTLVDTLMTWNGVTNTDWNTATNWTPPAGGTQYAPGVSNPAVNEVVIPNVGNQPNISATDIGIYSLNIFNGRTLTITSPRVLTIGGAPGGDLTLDGIISGGNLNLGTGTHVINNAGGTGSLSSTNVATVLSGSTVTLNQTLQAGALAVNAGGSMNITNRTLSLNGSGAALVIPGGATFTVPGSTVVFNGTAAQQAAGIAYNNLTINNTIGTNVTGVTLTGNASVAGTLALTSSDLDTGVFTLTQPNTTASTGVSDVVGTVTRSGGPFALATPLTFGNPDNRITFTVGATRPTSVTFVIAKAAPPNPNNYLAAVQRTYTISQTGGVGFTSTLRLHYLDSELNGNTEASLNLRRERTSDLHWVAALPSVVDTANNHVECNAVTDIMLSTRWTMSSLAPTAANGVVTGRIVDQSGMPVEGAVVRLQGTQNRKFITDANGFYRFENVETNGFYIATPSRANYSFNPQVRSFSQIGETTEAAFGATLTSGGFVNPLDTPEYFVRQHYIDFLGRDPDESGFNFWSDQIIECGFDQNCIERRRENVSAAYFLSIEFQQTGGLVDGLYRASYGARPQFAEFMPDARTVGLGVRVGEDGWEAKLQANKEAFVAAFVNRASFHALYDGMDSSTFVETLLSHTGVEFTASERDAWVGGLTNGTQTRADVLRSIAENGRFVNAKFNEAFVMMEYFGYLRRDADAGGFAFWLNKLNQFNGNFEQAEMVKAFIVSGEYRNRFPR